MKILIGKGVSYDTDLVIGSQYIVRAFRTSRPSVAIANDIPGIGFLGVPILPYTGGYFDRFSIANYTTPFCHSDHSILNFSRLN